MPKLVEFAQADDAQYEAITYDHPGPLLVLAGPGSGKTFTIINHIAHLIKYQKVPAETILVMTFTRDAARSMQKRFLNQTISLPSYSVNFGTFHSVFYQILFQSGPRQTFHFLNDREKKSLLLPIIKSILPDLNRAELENECLELQAAISYYKNTLQEDRTLSMLSNTLRHCFFDISEQYNRSILQKHCMDFDDILLQCKQKLENDTRLREYWQNRFRHIVIDEFQDINPIQYEVVKLLSAPPHHIFVVGDDDQSIYGFRGSAPDCMMRFQEELQAKSIYLNNNYRSTTKIVDASLRVISVNRNRFEKKMVSAGDQNASVSGISRIRDAGDNIPGGMVIRFENKHDEYQRLTELIQRSDTAVLFRTNRAMQKVAAVLRGKKIDFEMKEPGENFFEKEPVLDLMAYLSLIENPDDRNSIYRIMNKPNRYVKREVIGNSKSPILPAMAEYYYTKNLLIFDKLQLLMRHLESMKHRTLFLKLQYIRHVCGYDQYLEEKYRGDIIGMTDAKETVELLCEMSVDFQTLDQWIAYQKEYKTELYRKKEHGAGHCCKLMTIHASKGLEFKRVIIPDCNEHVYPHTSFSDSKEMEEERRIFYVGMTRAKEELYLLYVSGTKEHPINPSIFLNPLLSP